MNHLKTDTRGLNGNMAPERAVLSMYGDERKEMGIVDQEEGKEKDRKGGPENGSFQWAVVSEVANIPFKRARLWKPSSSLTLEVGIVSIS
jgi:hypothetical protein